MMWTPKLTRPVRPRTDNLSDEEEEKNRTHNANEKDQTTDQLARVLTRLELAIKQNTEVMKSAAEKIESLSLQNTILAPTDDASSPRSKMKRPGEVKVEVKLTFLKITDIDTVTQQFQAEIFVQAKWEEPLLKDSEYATGKILQAAPEDLDHLVPWDPNLLIVNIDGALISSRRTNDILFNHKGYQYPVVKQLWRFKGIFKENLELQHFPVDVQDLTISISTDRSDKEVILMEDQTALSSINTKAFMDSQEWVLYKHIETFRDHTRVEYCSSTIHPILHVQCRVGRKTGYFIWNIVFIMLLIISLTFAAFTIDPGSADRITVTITLFLTAVAFKLVVKQSLPTISYLTYLDVYVLASLIFLGMQAVQNSVMNAFTHFMGPEDVKFYDRWSMVSVAGVLVLFHLIFGYYIYKTASKRRRIMEEKDKLYKAKKKFLEDMGHLPRRYDSAMEAQHNFNEASIIPGRKLKQYYIKR